MTEKNDFNPPIAKSCRPKKIKAILKMEFPNCFKSGMEKLPLMIGIHEQLLDHYKDDPRFNPKQIQNGLCSYTSSPKYLSKIIEGASRIDLKGNSIGRVTPEEAAFAKNKLKNMEEFLQQKLELKEQNLVSHQKKSVKAAKAPQDKPVLKLLESANTKIKSAPQALTKEEIKKAKQDQYAKKMARRKR